MQWLASCLLSSPSTCTTSQLVRCIRVGLCLLHRRQHTHHPPAAAPHAAGGVQGPPCCARQPEPVSPTIQDSPEPWGPGPAELHPGADRLSHQRWAVAYFSDGVYCTCDKHCCAALVQQACPLQISCSDPAHHWCSRERREPCVGYTYMVCMPQDTPQAIISIMDPGLACVGSCETSVQS